MMATNETTTAARPARPLRVDQVAERLGCDPSTVRRMATAGEFPGAIQFAKGGHWRIPVEGLSAFLARRAKRS